MRVSRKLWFTSASHKLWFMSVSRKLYPLPLLLSFSSALAQRQDSVSLSQDMLNDPVLSNRRCSRV